MKHLGIFFALLTVFATSAWAQEGGGQLDPASEEQYRETEEIINTIQSRIDAINASSSARDKELEFLNKKINEAIRMIAVEQDDNSTLRDSNAAFETELQNLFAAQDGLNAQLTKVTDEREALIAQLQHHVSELAGLLSLEDRTATSLADRLGAISTEMRSTIGEKAKLEDHLEAARRSMAADEQSLQQRAERIETLESDIATLERVRSRLEAQVASLNQTVAASDSTVSGLQSELQALRQRNLGIERELAERSRRLEEQQASSRLDSTELKVAKGEIATLNRQLATLNEQLSVIKNALEASGNKVGRQEVKMADLTRRLNLALAERVQELSGYRSEFFGRLRQALGDRPDIHVVGDRFVFQSEVLFASGSAELDPGGRATLLRFARTLEAVAQRIPADIDWILRVDGHTDRVPVRRWYKSNWELSAARAISVVTFLVEQGLPPRHLAAAGFGEFQPLDRREDEIAYRRNRRIEFKLTQR